MASSHTASTSTSTVVGSDRNRFSYQGGGWDNELPVENITRATKRRKVHVGFNIPSPDSVAITDEADMTTTEMSNPASGALQSVLSSNSSQLSSFQRHVAELEHTSDTKSYNSSSSKTIPHHHEYGMAPVPTSTTTSSSSSYQSSSSSTSSTYNLHTSPIPTLTPRPLSRPTPKVVIFSEFPYFLTRLAIEFKALDISFSQLIGKSIHKHKELMRFKHIPTVRVLLLSSEGAHGLDLSFVTNIFLLNTVLNDSVEQQVISRAYRMGATHSVIVEEIYTQHTVEEQIYRTKHDPANKHSDEALDHTTASTNADIDSSITTTTEGIQKETTTRGSSSSFSSSSSSSAASKKKGTKRHSHHTHSAAAKAHVHTSQLQRLLKSTELLPLGLEYAT